MLGMAEHKMSKSLGNVLTMETLLAAGPPWRDASPGAAVRALPPAARLDRGAAGQCRTTLDRLYRVAADAAPTQVDAGVLDALADDLNTPLALARLGAVRDPGALRASAAFLGLLGGSTADWFQGDGDGDVIAAAIEFRASAKRRRDFAEADRIRADLAAAGILLEDGPAGTTWRRA
jgi:cysteinyl-tRNA synthetase